MVSTGAFVTFGGFFILLAAMFQMMQCTYVALVPLYLPNDHSAAVTVCMSLCNSCLVPLPSSCVLFSCLNTVNKFVKDSGNTHLSVPFDVSYCSLLIFVFRKHASLPVLLTLLPCAPSSHPRVVFEMHAVILF